MFFNRTASKLSVASASTLHEKSVRAIWEYAASGIRTSPPGYDLTSMDSSTCIKLGTVAQAIAKKAPTCPMSRQASDGDAVLLGDDAVRDAVEQIPTDISGAFVVADAARASHG